MTTEVDVCVVGGGLAGMTAALRAAELGRRVVVLEQSGEAGYLCNSRMTSGVFHLAATNVLSPPQELEDAVRAATLGTAHPGLARALAHNAERAVRWLQGHGIRFIRGGAAPYHNFVVSPPATHRDGPFDILGRGGDVLLRTLEAALQARGGEVRRGHQALALHVEAGRCRGVRVRTAADGRESVLPASNVVLADGGFQANPELLREHGISPDPARLVQRNAGSGRGDGLRMALAAGARASNLLGFYGHVMSRQALENPRLWPYPWFDLVAGAGIAVNGAGRRFADESRGGVYLANRIAALSGDAFAIFDQPIWDGPGKAFLNPPNPRFLNTGGSLVSAPTLAELAGKLGLPGDALADEVGRHNAAVDSGGCAALTPPRSAKPLAPLPIRTAPFHGVALAAGITHTMGGIAIDEWSRASTADGQVFPGLYVAGSATGGVEGGEHAGYVGGLVKAAVTGLRAAEHLAGHGANESREQP